jgi:hypothetical protein
MATRCYNCNAEIASYDPFALYRSVIEFYDKNGKQSSVDQTVRIVCVVCAHGAASHATRFPNGVGKESS